MCVRGILLIEKALSQTADIVLELSNNVCITLAQIDTLNNIEIDITNYYMFQYTQKIFSTYLVS